MFIYTRAYFQKLIDDFKLAGYLFNVLTPLVYIVYLIYALSVNVGYAWANITLLAVTVLYLVFYISTYDLKEKSVKATKKTVRHIYKGIKLSVGAMTLGITFYGIYVASQQTSTLSVVLSCFMAVFWVLQAGIELITYFIEYQTTLFMAALEADKDNLIKPITAVGNFVKRVTGMEAEENKEPKKILRILDKTIDKLKKKKPKDSSTEGAYGDTKEESEPLTK